MFGSDKRLEKKLRASGRTAPAEVVSAKRGMMQHSANMPGVADAAYDWSVNVLVRPDGEQPFSAHLTLRVPIAGTVAVGSFVTVLYDPSDHSKVVRDNSTGGRLGEVAEKLAARNGGNAAEIAALLQQRVDDPDAVDPSALAKAIGGTAVNPADVFSNKPETTDPAHD